MVFIYLFIYYIQANPSLSACSSVDALKIDKRNPIQRAFHGLGLSCNHQTILNFIHGVSSQHSTLPFVLAIRRGWMQHSNALKF